MPARRSTRGQKKKVEESLSSKPDDHSESPHRVLSSQTLDKVDGPDTVEATKSSQSMKKKSSRKTTAKQEKATKGCEQDDTVHEVEKKAAANMGKSLLAEVHQTVKQDSSKQNQKHKPQRGRVVKADKAEICQNDCGEKKSGEKESAHPADVKPVPRPNKKRHKSASSSVESGTCSTDRVVEPKISRVTKDTATSSSFIAVEVFTSSSSDFEEVTSQFLTPVSSLQSSTHSDSEICHKLEDSFSDCKNSQDLSVSVSSSDMTDTSSPACSIMKSDAGFTKHKQVTGGPANEGKASAQVSGRAAKVTAESKMATSENKKPVQNAEKSRSQQLKVKKSSKAENRAGISGRKSGTTVQVDENSVMAILMKMEGQPSQTGHADQPSTSGLSRDRRQGRPGKKSAPHKMADADSTEESDDWEEVEDYEHSPVRSQIPEKPVEITINDPTMIHKKRKKKKFDWKAYIQRRMKRMAREVQIEMHKVHLLCLLSHGIQQNGVCSEVSVCATALSMVPHSQLKKDIAFYDDSTLLLFLRWFRSMFCLSAAAESSCALVSDSQLLRVIQDGTADEDRLLVMVLVAMLRAMGFNVRLVISFQPLPLKTSSFAQDKAASKRKTKHRIEKSGTSSKKAKHASESKKTTDTGNGARKSTSRRHKCTTGGSTKHANDSDPNTASHAIEDKPTKCASKSGRKRKRRTKLKKSAHSSSSEEEDKDDDNDDDGPSVAKRRVSERVKKVMKRSTLNDNDDGNDDESGSEDGGDVSLSDGSNFSEEEARVLRKKIKGQGKGKGKKQSGMEVADRVDDGSDGEFDSSFQPKSLLVKDGRSKKANRKILSDESSEEDTMESKGRDYWLEVYLPRQSKWFCVDCLRCTVGKPYDTSSSASQPLLYVLGFDNNCSVKDITAKYAPQWLSHTRKLRVDSDWWRASLEPYTSQNTAVDDKENRDIKDHLVQRPLPTNIGDYKNHPLYALRRHLLKYQAIYPENSIPVGYIRQEPVYARECVHTLHSRENWLREARLVRIGETPYKLVKSRKRWNRARDNPEELDLELFGRWQTEDYIPLPAVNGKVPKNEYGNVELFQPSMLPGGTVHVRVPALNRVARKLGIDIAAAMTGWDHHCGYSHPVLDGWVVCEEHKDVLLAAWEEDQGIQRQREEERREKRVLNNWTTLVRGLLIKDKLKKRFNLEDKPGTEMKVKKRAKPKKGEKATDVQHAWPAKQQQRQQHKQKEQALEAAPTPSHFTVETM